MANIKYDSRIVLTLDAGGTNMVFAAMRGGEYIGEPITQPAQAQDLELCLSGMVKGFQRVINELGGEKPVAISFAFPGPADYPNGIIGGFLPNFPSFRDGVALGPFLEKKFGIPVFINNDGDLYAYGESIGGALPEVNAKLAAMGSAKRYHNLLGYTFGTGFGLGTVIDGKLNRGDNSCVETFCLKHPDWPDIMVEDGVAVRAVKRVYGELSGNMNHGLEPKDIGAISRHHEQPQVHHAGHPQVHEGQDAPAHRRGTQPRADEGLQPRRRSRVLGIRKGRGPQDQGFRLRR